MSIDLVIFDPLKVNYKDQRHFAQWLDALFEVEESTDVNDPSIASAPLQSWFHAMRVDFPALNGPFRVLGDNPQHLDYCFSPAAVDVSYWLSNYEKAAEKTWAEAVRFGLGLFDPQSGVVFAPNANGDDLEEIYTLE